MKKIKAINLKKLALHKDCVLKLNNAAAAQIAGGGYSVNLCTAYVSKPCACTIVPNTFLPGTACTPTYTQTINPCYPDR